MAQFGGRENVETCYANQSIPEEAAKYRVSSQSVDPHLQGFGGFFLERRSERIRLVLEPFQPD
jgi:hypothetical protein